MAGRERQPDKYAVEWFLIYQYKNILNLNGKSSLTQNILHEKSLQYRNMRLKKIGYRRRIGSCSDVEEFLRAEITLREQTSTETNKCLLNIKICIINIEA